MRIRALHAGRRLRRTSIAARSVALAALAALTCVAAGCGTRAPVSALPYSRWVYEYGPSEEGNFERQRRACLERAGGPEKPDENVFIQCMNGSGWCTVEFGCEPPTYPER